MSCRAACADARCANAFAHGISVRHAPRITCSYRGLPVPSASSRSRAARWAAPPVARSITRTSTPAPSHSHTISLYLCSKNEKNGKWDGYSMINCEPIVRTDQDGYARIRAVFPRELCIWQATDEETGICTFEDFSATISSTLLIPQITTSDPLDIQLVRTQTTVGCP